MVANAKINSLVMIELIYKYAGNWNMSLLDQDSGSSLRWHNAMNLIVMKIADQILIVISVDENVVGILCAKR